MLGCSAIVPSAAPDQPPVARAQVRSAVPPDSYHAAAPRVSHRSRNSFTLARDRVDSAPSEQLFR